MRAVYIAVLLAVLAMFLLVGSAGAVRIYLNPSDQTGNWSPDGTYNEASSMQNVANRLATKLANRGFEVQNSNGASMSAACNAANSWPADAFVSIHSNASGGSGWHSQHGSMGFYYQSSGGWHSSADVDLADRCVNKCVEKLAAWGRGYKIGTFADYPYYGYNLYVLANTTMTSTLVEGLFHDNYDDVQVLKSDAGKDAYAQALYEAVCDHFGWSYDEGLRFSSDVTVASNADGRLEVFVRGSDNAMWHKYQLSPNGGWSNWYSLGGSFTDKPAAYRNADGRMQVFARGTDGNLGTAYCQSNGVWTNFYGMGIAISGSPAVSVNLDGRMELFVRGTNNQIYHSYQLSPNSSWSSWYSLGGNMTDYPVAGPNADGRLQVFCRGADGALNTSYCQSNGVWTNFFGMDATLVEVPALAINSDGRMELFIRGTTNSVYHSYQTAPNSGWTGWASLDGQITDHPAAARNSDGHLEAFARAGDGAVWHSWVQPDGVWTGWYSLGGSTTGSPSVGQNQDGRLELFVRGSDNIVYHNYQIANGGGWSGWSVL